jgi:hypothetical protein
MTISETRKQVARLYYSQNLDYTDQRRFNFSTDFAGVKGFNQYGEASHFLLENRFQYKSWYEESGRPIEIWERPVNSDDKQLLSY